MIRKGEVGTCHICGYTSILSFEHVPPKSAYNKKTFLQYNLEDKVKGVDVQGRKIQGGVRVYTLCKSCNNNTGAWYASEYVDWAHIGHDVLESLKLLGSPGEISITFKEVYPLRFLKQVVVLFFSISSVGNALAKSDPKLSEFVLNKESTDLPEGFRFFMRLFESSSIRHMPLAAKLPITYNKTSDGEIIDLRAGNPTIFSEVTHRPFALVMTMDGENFSDATEITQFAKFGYDDKVDLPLTLQISYKDSHYPSDY